MTGIKMNKVDTILRTVLVLGVISTISIPLPVFTQTATCQGLPATIIGTAGDDVLIGTSGNDVIAGLGGNDFINGNEGDDIICGQEGRDTLYGHLGNDFIDGGEGNDIINGGPDNDRCVNGETNYYCEIMNDDVNDTVPPSVSIVSPSNGVSVSGTITISAVATDNVGITNAEFYVDGELIGSDTTNNYALSWNTLTVSNGPHILTARAYDAAGNVADSDAVSITVNNVILDPNTEVVTCRGMIATIIGTPDSDHLEGTEGNDVIHGLGGGDFIEGFGGDDIICGGDGNDNLLGYSGSDILDGGSGNDIVAGSSGDDILYGGEGRDLLVGGSGNDELYGEEGIDFLDGGSGEDICIGENRGNCP